MTSLKFSKNQEPDSCPKCNGPLSLRPAHGYPVLLQAVFAVSFVVFLMLIEKLKPWPILLWGWSGVQAILGYYLLKGRLRTRARVFVCIRCGTPLS
jgi:hypothetical protein